MKDAQIVIHTQELDYLDVHVEDYDWSKTVYGDISEITPKDIPQPLGKYVTLSHYVNAYLYHDMMTPQSIGSPRNKQQLRWLYMEASSLLPGFASIKWWT